MTTVEALAIARAVIEREVVPKQVNSGTDEHEVIDAMMRSETNTSWQFRPLLATDMAMFADWLMRPHVAEWWGDANPMAEVAECYAAPISETVSHWCCIAELNGELTGCIQSYAPAAFHDDGWWLDELDSTVRGIEQSLANAQQLGRDLAQR